MSDRFALAAEPQALVTRQVADRPELAHLCDARLVCLFAPSPLLLRGSPCAAFVGHPLVQGPMREWFDWAMVRFCEPVLAGEPPDFLILFDGVLWPLLGAERRDRLVYHELLHIQTRDDEWGIPKMGKDDRLLLRLVPHDRELFDAELLRYGAAVCGHDDLAGILREGDAHAARRKLTVVARG